jgi:TatD DNase family protein
LKSLTPRDLERIVSYNERKCSGVAIASEESTIAYMIRNSLYLNITNRCSNRCTFCPKFDEMTVKGHELRLRHEPDYSEVITAIDELDESAVYDEVVFCGFGESLIRLDLVREVAVGLKRRGLKVRINTDGQANLVHGRNILPELAGLIDTVSVSLNAADATTYKRLCNTPYGEAGFAGVCAFIQEATRHIPLVIASAVVLPGLDVANVRELALSLGATFRERPYAEVG